MPMMDRHLFLLRFVFLKKETDESLSGSGEGIFFQITQRDRGGDRRRDRRDAQRAGPDPARRGAAQKVLIQQKGDAAALQAHINNIADAVTFKENVGNNVRGLTSPDTDLIEQGPLFEHAEPMPFQLRQGNALQTEKRVAPRNHSHDAVALVWDLYELLVLGGCGGERRIAIPKEGQVELLSQKALLQLHRIVLDDFRPDLRVLLLKAQNQMNDIILRHSGYGPDGQKLSHALCQLGFVPKAQRFDLPGIWQEMFPIRGDCHLPGAAIEESDPQFRFQRFDVLGKGRLVHIQTLGGFSKAAGLRQNEELLQIHQVQRAASFINSKPERIDQKMELSPIPFQ